MLADVASRSYKTQAAWHRGPAMRRRPSPLPTPPSGGRAPLAVASDVHGDPPSPLRGNDRARAACPPLDLAIERAQRHVFPFGEPDVHGVGGAKPPSHGGLACLTCRTRSEG